MEQIFVFGKPVEDKSFTDREKETARLLANFSAGINSFIISPRRWGKTSLVKKVMTKAEQKGIVCVFVDVFKARTPFDFCQLLGNAVLKQTSSAFEELMEDVKQFLGRIRVGINMSPDEINPLKIELGMGRETDTYEDILSLPEKIAVRKGINIIICIDEFQQIAEFEDSLTFQKQLRTVWQHQRNVSYCLFGSKKHMMESLFDDQGKPFYKFGDIIYLKRIPLSYWTHYISSRFTEAGKSMSPELIEKICSTVEFHSSYVQQLCWYVYLFSGSEVQEEDVTEGIEELIAQNTALFESRTETLSPVQMRFLTAVADGINEGFSSSFVISKYKLGSSASSVATRKALTEKGFLYEEEGRIHLADPVLGLWLKRP